MSSKLLLLLLGITIFAAPETSLASNTLPSPRTRLAFASPCIPPPPPISVPVWSLASPILSSGETSMNIVTFATPVSVSPPKLWVVSLYTNTQTRDSFLSSKMAVLQLLKPSLKNLVPILGKRSGYEVGFSKRDSCSALGHAWVSSTPDKDSLMKVQTSASSSEHDESHFAHMDLLPDCASYIRLKLLSTVEAGDHDVAVCEVEATGLWDEDRHLIVPTQEGAPAEPLDGSTVLYTGLLRDEGII